MTEIIPFVLAVLLLLATPGPTNTLLAASGAAFGFVRSLKLVPAEMAGYLTSILGIGLIIGPTLWHRPWASTLVHVGVAIYQAALSFRLWRAKPHNEDNGRRLGPATVFLTTLLNPKAAIFALVIIPMRDPSWPDYIVGFAVLMTLMSPVWIAAGSALGKGFALNQGSQIVSRVGATVIGGFALFVLWPVINTYCCSAV